MAVCGFSFFWRVESETFRYCVVHFVIDYSLFVSTALAYEPSEISAAGKVVIVHEKK